MSEWISVKDQPPPENINLILYDGQEVFFGNCDGKDEQGNINCGVQACDGICYGWCNKYEITHWMPLPKPPKRNE